MPEYVIIPSVYENFKEAESMFFKYVNKGYQVIIDMNFSDSINKRIKEKQYDNKKIILINKFIYIYNVRG
jgi:hypothetical protein